MNIFKKIKQISGKGLVAAILTSSVALSAVLMPLASAQQGQILWEGWTKSRNITAGETEYKDVTNAKPDDVVRVELWHHNRENPAGPQANNVRVRFIVPSTEGTSHVITGISSADNAPTISDTTTVNTAPDATKLEYIPGSSKFRYNKGAQDGNPACETGFEYPPASCYATVPVPDSVVTTGVNLDTLRGGPLRGCNAHHETVIIEVVGKKRVTPPPSIGICKAITVEAFDNRRVKVSIDGRVNNAQILGFEIDFGDGTKSTKQVDEHQYAADGTYRIVSRVQIKFADGRIEWVTSTDCAKEVTFKGEQPPVVVTPSTPVTPTPTVLPDTGAGSIAGIVAATTVAGMIAYRFVWLRRYQ